MAESTDVVRHAPPQLADVAAMSDADLERMYRVAKALALSKRFPDARTADEAFAKVLLGRDLGLSPTQAMTGIYIVEGKPQIAATTLAGFVRKSARYDYGVAELTDERCAIDFYSMETEANLGQSVFSIDEAKRAGLVKEKGGWVKYPRNMLFARAMSNGVKWFCPDLMGGVPIYTEGDVFEGSAAEIATGTGDGSEPGWGDMREESIAVVEGIIERAKAFGHAGLSDRATVQVSLVGQPESVVAMWVSRARAELEEFEERRNPPADEILRGEHGVMEQAEGPSASTGKWAREPEAPSEVPQTEADHAQLQADLDRILDRIAAEEEAGADEAVLADLEAEQERIERLLGHEEPGEGQETMPL